MDKAARAALLTAKGTKKKRAGFDQGGYQDGPALPPRADDPSFYAATPKHKPYFGEFAAGMAAPHLQNAYNLASTATTMTPNQNSYVPEAVQRINHYLANMGLAGLSTVGAGIYGAAGAAGDVANAVGIPHADRLVNDLGAMADTAGALPEGRMIASLTQPAIAQGAEAVDAAQLAQYKRFMAANTPAQDVSAFTGRQFYSPNQNELMSMKSNPLTPEQAAYWQHLADSDRLLQQGASAQATADATGILRIPRVSMEGDVVGPHREHFGATPQEMAALRPDRANMPINRDIKPEEGNNYGYFDDTTGQEHVWINPGISKNAQKMTQDHEMIHVDEYTAGIPKGERGTAISTVTKNRLEALNSLAQRTRATSDPVEKARLSEQFTNLQKTSPKELYYRNNGELYANAAIGDQMAKRLTPLQTLNPYLNRNESLVNRAVGATSQALLGETTPLMSYLQRKGLLHGYADEGVHVGVPLDVSKAVIGMPPVAKNAGGAVGKSKGGALDNASENIADYVADLLRHGRAKEVTDDLMAQADPQRLHQHYTSGNTGMDLPMDYASRMARAAQMGFSHARRSQSTETPFNDVPWAQFSHIKNGDVEGAMERLQGYGQGQWLGKPSLNGVDAAKQMVRAGRESKPFHGLTGAEVARRAFPQDIVTGAGLWDDPDTAKHVTDEIVNTGGKSIQTPDGMVAFGKDDQPHPTDNSVRSYDARFDPRLDHLAHLSASTGGAMEFARHVEAVHRAGGQIAPSKYLPNVPRQVHADGGRVDDDNGHIYVVHGGSDFDQIDPSYSGRGEPGNIRPLGNGLYGDVIDHTDPELAARSIEGAKNYARKYGRGEKTLHVFKVPKSSSTVFNGYREVNVEGYPKPIEGLGLEPTEELNAYRAHENTPQPPYDPENSADYWAHERKRRALWDAVKNAADLRMQHLPIGVTEVAIQNPKVATRIGKFSLDTPTSDILDAVKRDVQSRAAGGRVHANGGGKMELRSRAAEAIRNQPQLKGNVNQLLAVAAKGKGVKQAELANAGQPSGNIISKEELARHFEDAMPDVQVHEMVHPQYEDFTLPSGNNGGNYREHLLHLPPRKSLKQLRREALTEKLRIAKETGDEKAAREASTRLNWMGKPSNDNDVNENYYSTHWGKGVPNVLAHVRMNDLYDDSGKALHVQEVQSDWGQDGREKGFYDPQKPIEVFNSKTGETVHATDNSNEAEKFATNLGSEYDWIHQGEEKPPMGPYVGNTQHWTDLALKHVLTEAAYGGHNRVVFSPGEANADLYGQRRPVSRIDLHTIPNSESLGVLAGYDGEGDIVKKTKVKDEKHLRQLVGKQHADKLLAAPSAPASVGKIENVSTKSISDPDMVIGGHGMVDYYNNIVHPSALKLLQQHDPSIKPESYDLPNGYKGFGLPMTETARQSILKNGFGAFKRGGTVGKEEGGATSSLREKRLWPSAQEIKAGTGSREAHEALVNKIKPVSPYSAPVPPAPDQKVHDALTKDKQPKAFAPRQLKEGTPVAVRLDIPAYEKKNTWVVSVHHPKSDFTAGEVIGYDSVAHIGNPRFGVHPTGALNIASGKPKATIATIHGNWKKTTPENAFRLSQAIHNDPQWRQVGMDPERHSYFYDRETQEPVMAADEALHIGPLVYAKNPVYGKKTDFAFSKGGEVEQMEQPANGMHMLRMRRAGINTKEDFWNRWRDHMRAKAMPNLNLSAIGSKDSHFQQIDNLLNFHRQSADANGIRGVLQRYGQNGQNKDGSMAASMPKAILQGAGIEPTVDNASQIYHSLPDDESGRVGKAGGGEMDGVESNNQNGVSNVGTQNETGIAPFNPAPRAQAGELRDAGRVRGGSGVLQTPDEAPLEGLLTPVTIPMTGQVIHAGPDPRIRQVARDYMASTGLPYNPPKKYAKADPTRALRISDAYEAMEDNSSDPLTKASYAAMIKETMAQYHAAKAAGFKAEFWDPQTQEDPYHASPRLATEDIKNNNHMFVFPTDSGYGSDGPITAEQIKTNPLLQPSGETWNGIPVTVNDIFRAVHDYFGHAKEGVGFRADGEENAWRSHAAMYSPLARMAMTSETRGQNSWLNFNPVSGERNRKARTENSTFADQKVGILPHWVHHEGAEDFMGPEEVNAMAAIRNVHGRASGGIVDAALALTRRFSKNGTGATLALKPKGK